MNTEAEVVAANSVIERVSNAVESLAIGRGDVRDRLRVAGSVLAPLRPSDFPEKLQDRFNSIKDNLTRYPPVGSEGEIEATMKRIKNSTGERIAKSIFELYVELQRIRNQQLP